MNKTQRTFLFDLLQTPSPTGFEAPGQRKWAAFTRKHADRVESDAYGTAWATLDGKSKQAPTIMIEAHADEIGYMVKQVTSEGFLRLDRIGGSDAATARGRRLDIFGDNGTVRGIIGNTAIHMRNDPGAQEKAPKPEQLYVDIGATSAKQVEEAGIRVGHAAVYADGPEEFGKNKLSGRALDNRIGGFIIARVIAELTSKNQPRPPATCVAVNAVQEEIGGYGAKMVAYRLMPDLCLVLDVTHATDTPGIDQARHGEVTLGGGPTLTHGTGNHIAVVKRLQEVAKKAGIPIQHEASSRATGTDTDSIYHMNEGIPSALISLPMRYMHSVVETVDLEDVEKVISLMTAFIRSVKVSDRFSVKI